MASLARFGFLLLVLAIVAKAQLQESDNFKNLEELSQRILAIKQQSNDQSILSRLRIKRYNRDLSVSKEDDNLSKYRQDMVAAINKKRFAFAEEEMLKKNDPVAVAEIVSEVYQNAGNRPHLLIEFTMNLKDKNIKEDVMKNLLKLSGMNNEEGTLQAVHFLKAVSDVIGKRNPIPKSFEKLLDDLVQALIWGLAETMRTKGTDYRYDVQIRELTNAIAGLRDVPKRVMIGLVNEVYGSVDTTVCFRAIESNLDPWQVLYGFGAMLEKFQKANDFDNLVVIKIAAILDKTSRKANNLTLMRMADYLLKKLPKWIFNMFDLQTFCIWNRREDVYLTCSEYKIEKSDDSWPILGTPRSEVNTYNRRDIEWQIRQKSNEDSVFFTNPNKGNVVMVSDSPIGSPEDYATSDVTAYRVSKFGFPTSHGFGAFIIEPKGNQFYLKTAKNDYVVASGEYWAGSPYKAILLKPNEKSASSLWEIKRCISP